MRVLIKAGCTADFRKYVALYSVSREGEEAVSTGCAK
jgi:hypothetical protein